MLKTVKNGCGIRVDPPPPCFFKIPPFSRFFFLATSLKCNAFTSKNPLIYYTLVKDPTVMFRKVQTTCSLSIAGVHYTLVISKITHIIYNRMKYSCGVQFCNRSGNMRGTPQRAGSRKSGN